MTIVNSERVATILSTDSGSSISLQARQSSSLDTPSLSNLPSRPAPAYARSRQSSYAESNPPPSYSKSNLPIYSRYGSGMSQMESSHNFNALNRFRQKSTETLKKAIPYLYQLLIEGGLISIIAGAVSNTKPVTIAGGIAMPAGFILLCIDEYYQLSPRPTYV